MKDLNFCTLFDVNYLTRGLALIESLRRHSPNCKIWVLCMDERTHELLSKLNIPRLEAIRISELERSVPELIQAKENRSAMEYCWTLTPVLPKFLLDRNPTLSHITYVDADVYFFDSPDRLFSELGSGSVLIFEHKFPPTLEHQVETQGRYNVEVIVFQNNASAKECLTWWQERCLEWCYHRVEPGRMGDQKYLDEWPQRFDGVVVASDRVPALAPWNFSTYDISENEKSLFANGTRVLFVHFSKLAILSSKTFRCCKGYLIPRLVKRLAYSPYVNSLKKQFALLREIDREFSGGIVVVPISDLIGDAWHKLRLLTRQRLIPSFRR